jgi:phage-related protein
MKGIGPRCHELRVRDEEHHWRIFYRIDPDAILVIDVMAKKTQKTPKAEIALCRKRLAAYDRGEGPIQEGERRG